MEQNRYLNHPDYPPKDASFKTQQSAKKVTEATSFLKCLRIYLCFLVMNEALNYDDIKILILNSYAVTVESHPNVSADFAAALNDN